MIFLLNKVDLQPISVTRKWVGILQKERPTLAFHASITKARFLNKNLENNQKNLYKNFKENWTFIKTKKAIWKRGTDIPT